MTVSYNEESFLGRRCAVAVHSPHKRTPTKKRWEEAAAVPLSPARLDFGEPPEPEP